MRRMNQNFLAFLDAIPPGQWRWLKPGDIGMDADAFNAFVQDNIKGDGFSIPYLHPNTSTGMIDMVKVERSRAE